MAGSLSCILVACAVLMLTSGVRGPETDPVPVTEPVPTIITPRYEVHTELHAITPSCIMVTWELNPPIDSEVYAENELRIARVKTWKVELSITRSRFKRTEGNQDLERTTNEFYLAGPANNLTVGPIPLGSSVRAKVLVKRYYKPDGRTKEVYDISGANNLELPGNDIGCQKPFGERESPCSSCVCTSSAFTGPSCNEPNFHPQNVSAFAKSETSLAIQWTFNATKNQRDLQRVGYNLTAISLTVTEIGSGAVIVRDSIPINNQSETYYYQVYQSLTSGLEYDVVVGVAAVSASGRIVTAIAPPVRMFVPEGTKEESTLRNVILPSVVVSVAIVSCLIASVASVIITRCCMQAISSKEQLPNNGAVNLNSHLHPLGLPNMERNPAYGQVFVDSAEIDAQTGLYEDTADTGDKTGTGTYDYVN